MRALAGFEIGEGRAAFRCGFLRGCGGNVRVALEQGGEIPSSVAGAHDVDARLGRTQRGDLQASAQQGTKADRGENILRADHGLGAEGGIVVDDKTFKIEARPRQRVQPHIVDGYAAAESVSDGTGNPVAQFETRRDGKETAQRERTAMAATRAWSE